MCSNQKGFSLVEMLITLAIFSVILSSLTYVQLKNTQATGEQYFEQMALNLIHNAYEQCQMSGSGVSVYLKEKTKTQLPQGEGEIVDDAEHLYIAVSWFSRYSPKKRSEVIVDV